MQNCPTCGSELEKYHLDAHSDDKTSNVISRRCPKCEMIVEVNQYNKSK